MVRKQVFSREDVIAAGIAVVARFGIDGLSARHVADELGASTAPVYSNFANMDELAVAVRQAVTEQILEFTTRRFTDDSFFNMGVGVLEFARQQPGLYSAIFMDAQSKCDAGPALRVRLAKRMAALEDLAELPAAERLMLLHQMGVFTHGLAVRLVTGMSAEITFDDLVLFLHDAGAAMIAHARSRPERTPAETALMARLMDLNQKDENRDS